MEKTTYTKWDGFRAIILYVVGCIIPVIYCGILPQTRISDDTINILQFTLDYIPILLCLMFVKYEKRGLSSIGIRLTKSWKHITILLIGTVIMVSINGVFSCIFMEKTHITTLFGSYINILIFLPGAIEEELTCRAYLQTRLRGLIDNEKIVLFIGSFLFLLSHYPVMWCVGEWFLPIERVILLIILGLVCGIQYNKTNNVWIPIITHFIYNMVQFV